MNYGRQNRGRLPKSTPQDAAPEVVVKGAVPDLLAVTQRLEVLGESMAEALEQYGQRMDAALALLAFPHGTPEREKGEDLLRKVDRDMALDLRSVQHFGEE